MKTIFKKSAIIIKGGANDSGVKSNDFQTIVEVFPTGKINVRYLGLDYRYIINDRDKPFYLKLVLGIYRVYTKKSKNVSEWK